MDRDRRRFEELLRFLDKKKISGALPQEILIEIGRFFLGAPYVAGTLEEKGDERLVVNLREFDCVTFLETVLALTCCFTSGRKSFEAFRKLLRRIRYRQGRLRGYCSRLHYFSDWIEDNRKKGIVRNITADIGGRPLRKDMTLMTTHPELYPALKDEGNLRKMKSVERAISQRTLSFIPKERVKRLEGRIRDGDLIAITTDKEGIDVLHVALAARVRNRVHLLHASAKEGKVVLSGQTLYGYLMGSKARSGIMMARIAGGIMEEWNIGMMGRQRK